MTCCSVCRTSYSIDIITLMLLFWLGLINMFFSHLWESFLVLCRSRKKWRKERKKRKKPSKIISLIKFRTSGERPSCAHELEKYWACPQRKTGLHRGWLIVNKMGGMFPHQPAEHQQCHHAPLPVYEPRPMFVVHSETQARSVACHKAQWIHARCRLNINNSASIARSPLFPS